MQNHNLNDARSTATRARLIDSTVDALVELGFAKTSGVEVCRRSGLSRGALNHHFPDFADLLVETLQTLYARLLDVKLQATLGPLERVVLESYERVSQPSFKAVIELWLASRNDPEFGGRLASAIELGSTLFSPQALLAGVSGVRIDAECEALYHTICEALIGIGLGRAIGGGDAMDHERSVLAVLQKMARDYDVQSGQRLSVTTASNL
ncbi:TetR/AcrR family transcriptional regulator [Congregibacter variabilis]|uniref:TetR/AcrR family transcriptional regulator n=1 Tax=Congregibacter variabilis TaxID=3081200 RepID=A0ABZ0HXP6_9GAMM|nr:TetR/AcrR family transcriptional regulator [Congregibacter sp. IMCC43200]